MQHVTRALHGRRLKGDQIAPTTLTICSLIGKFRIRLGRRGRGFRLHVRLVLKCRVRLPKCGSFDEVATSINIPRL